MFCCKVALTFKQITDQPTASLPRYDQVHGNVPTRGQPQLPSYTASPTPEPPTSNADEDQTGVSSLEEIHVAAMDGVKSATMKKLVANLHYSNTSNLYCYL